MARPRKGVDIDNGNYVFRYFKTSFNDPIKSLSLVIEDRMIYEACNKLNEITSYNVCYPERYSRAVKRRGEGKEAIELHKEGSELVDIDLLDKWVLKYINNDGWKKCLNNIRQGRFTNDNKHVTTQVRMSSYTHSQLKKMAKEEGANTFDEYLSELENVLGGIKKISKSKGLTTLEYLKGLSA